MIEHVREVVSLVTHEQRLELVTRRRKREQQEPKPRGTEPALRTPRTHLSSSVYICLPHLFSPRPRPLQSPSPRLTPGKASRAQGPPQRTLWGSDELRVGEAGLLPLIRSVVYSALQVPGNSAAIFTVSSWHGTPISRLLSLLPFPPGLPHMSQRLPAVSYPLFWATVHPTLGPAPSSPGWRLRRGPGGCLLTQPGSCSRLERRPRWILGEDGGRRSPPSCPGPANVT